MPLTLEQRRARERDRQRRKRALARELALVRPRDLEALQRTGTVHPSLADVVLAADFEKLEILAALEGERLLPSGLPNPDHRPLSPQQIAILDDFVGLGIVRRGELRRYAQGLDGEAGARVGTLAATRARLLGQLGLTRREPDAIDLRDYLRERGQDAPSGAQHANGAGPEPEPARAEIDPGIEVNRCKNEA